MFEEYGHCIVFLCRHFGDLGSIEESRDGTVGHVMKDYALSLLGPFSILGRAVVVSLCLSLVSRSLSVFGTAVVVSRFLFVSGK